MRVDFKQATVDDVGALCRRGMRSSDVQEIQRLGMADPYMAVLDSLEDSEVALAAYTPHGIACLIGVVRHSLLSNDGLIWMVGSDDLTRYAIRFLKESQKVLSHLTDAYPKLENWVDAENKSTIAWLEWLGFTIDRDNPAVMPTGFPFYHFWKEATHVR